MNKDIDTFINDALNSADGLSRAVAKPYLFTRLMANMQRREESRWGNMVKLISRPAIAVAGLCLIATINVLVMLTYKEANTDTTEEQLLTTEEYPDSVTALYDTEINEP